MLAPPRFRAPYVELGSPVAGLMRGMAANVARASAREFFAASTSPLSEQGPSSRASFRRRTRRRRLHAALVGDDHAAAQALAVGGDFDALGGTHVDERQAKQRRPAEQQAAHAGGARHGAGGDVAAMEKLPLVRPAARAHHVCRAVRCGSARGAAAHASAAGRLIIAREAAASARTLPAAAGAGGAQRHGRAAARGALALRGGLALLVAHLARGDACAKRGASAPRAVMRWTAVDANAS